MLFSNELIEKYLIESDKMKLFENIVVSNGIKKEAIKYGEKYIDFDWGSLSLVLYMEFVRNGNRVNYEDINFERRKALNCLVTAEFIEKEGRFIDNIINGIWAICEETTWVLPAHNGGNIVADIKKPSIDLFAAQTASQLALCIYLLREELDAISEEIVKRVEYEIEKRIIEPFLKYNFWWMGYGDDRRSSPSNWTPWCCSTCIMACLFAVRDNHTRIKFIQKSCEILNYYIQNYPEDGGCDEGAQYWYNSAGSMFDCLELLYLATDGKLDVFNMKKINEMGSYIYKSHISGKYFINFADCAAIADRGGARTYLFGKRVGNRSLMAFGADDFKALDEKLLPDNMNLLHKLFSILHEDEIKRFDDVYTPLESNYTESLQLYSGIKNGVSLAVKGGHNADNHNHNDVGSFMVYADEIPIIIDVGVESYSKKTFSSERYSIWTMQSAYHNLPTVNGVMQCDGSEYKAKNVVVMENGMSFDISDAYPKTSEIVKWQRDITIDNLGVSVIEDLSLENPSDDVYITFMTWKEPIIDKGGVIVSNMMISCDHDLDIKIEKINIPFDAKLTPVWDKCVYRIKYKFKNKVQIGKIAFRINRRK